MTESKEDAVAYWWVSWWDYPVDPDDEDEEYKFSFEDDDVKSWITGYNSDNGCSVIAAVPVSKASTADDAKAYILECYSESPHFEMEWRFADPIYEGVQLPWDRAEGRFSE